MAKQRRASSARDAAGVRSAMAQAVALKGRCNRCGAVPGETGVTLHAHWPKTRLGRRHLPVPSLYEVLCDSCHAQATRAGE